MAGCVQGFMSAQKCRRSISEIWPTFTFSPRTTNKIRLQFSAAMALIQVSQTLFENEISGVKWRRFLRYRYGYGAHIWPVDYS